MNLETLRITKIINGGYGCGRLATGQVILVRHVLPGETVTVVPEKIKRRYLFGRLHSLQEQHVARRTPPCRYYYQCGGCDLQHCDYDTQLTIKKDIATDLLERQDDKDVQHSARQLQTPLASPLEWGYRQRIRLRVGERSEVGFYRHRSHEIVSVDECLLAGKTLNHALAILKDSDQSARLLKLSSEVELLLNPLNNSVVCVFSFTRPVRPADVAAARKFCLEDEVLGVVYFKGIDFPLHGPVGHGDKLTAATGFAVRYPSSRKTPHSFMLTWEPGGFCQVNLFQNRHLIETVVAFSEVSASDSVLDLYCGMGNFSIPLAFSAKSVTGIEGQGAAIRSAKHNAELAGAANTNFYKRPIHEACIDLTAAGTSFDCVILDPPRSGAPELADKLTPICAHRLVYISCDPATLCRDLVSLCQQGFTIKKIQPVDMFPQTHHIETVVLLER
ncbi:MAG: 23S rRNA (uracil(1939)-C(5))-methyltransferase RlmD [Desulforhopalus sp.]